MLSSLNWFENMAAAACVCPSYFRHVQVCYNLDMKCLNALSSAGGAVLGDGGTFRKQGLPGGSRSSEGGPQDA